jgi:hypothetical protein
MYTVFQTEEFVVWLDDLKDKRAVAYRRTPAAS